MMSLETRISSVLEMNNQLKFEVCLDKSQPVLQARSHKAICKLCSIRQLRKKAEFKATRTQFWEMKAASVSNNKFKNLSKKNEIKAKDRAVHFKTSL